MRGRKGERLPGAHPSSRRVQAMHSARGGGPQPHGVNRILLHFSIENHKVVQAPELS